MGKYRKDFDVMDQWIIAFDLFGSFFAFVIGLGQLVQRHNRHKAWISSLFFTLSFLIFYFTLVDSRFILHYPHLLFFNIPVLYLLSPLLFIYITILTTENFTWDKKYFLHFVPTGVSIATTMPFILQNREQKLFMLENVIYKGDFSTANFLLIIPTILVLGYLGYLFWINNPFMNYRDKKTLLLNLILGFWALAALIGGIIFIKGDVHFVRYVIVFLNISLIAIFLIGQYDPVILTHISREIRLKKYENSHLTNVNLESLEQGLNELFESRKIHRNSDLSLKKAAKKLNVSTHQLSQFINEHKKTNFSNFINAYRVKDAAALLGSDADRTILDIAYEAGFNSTSSFHEAFRKVYGMTPAEFRKNSKKENQSPA